MKILFVASECEPYVKVGGLGDVVLSLAVALKDLGNDVRIVLPKYNSLNLVSECKAIGQPMIVNMGHGTEFALLLQTEYRGLTLYLIEFDKYFGRNGIYGEFGGSYSDNWERFAFFCRATIDMCPFLNWHPDIIHANDWPTGLVPVFTKIYNKPPGLHATRSIFTIHNMAHQGYAPRELLSFAGLYEHFWHPFALEACGAVNVMKGALQFSDKITTVSASYAEEIKTPAQGYGLDDVLRYRARDLSGICNGIDTDTWNPKTDKFLPKNFSINSIQGKSVCKNHLQQRLNLPAKADIPLFAVISRFFEQKGLDVLCDIMPDILRNLSVQFAILGAGDPQLERRFCDATTRFSDKIFTKIGFDNELAHLMEAGSDFFVMPSRYEPCGLNQMYSMAYGSLPIVRATGGLRDTVKNYDEATGTGTGFVFNDLNHSSLYNTIGWACSTYYDRKEHIKKMQKQAMQQDFSWARSAKQYENIYKSAL